MHESHESPSLDSGRNDATPRTGIEEEASPSRISALIRLLGDESQDICVVAWKNLEKIGEPVLPQVESAVRDGNDERVQVQCARFLREWRRKAALKSWVEFTKTPPLHLEDGVFLIARTEYPEADAGAYRARLDEYAAALRGRLASAQTVDEAVGKISSFLFEEQGFRGNQEDYYDPQNSYMNRVLDRKVGIPITLAGLFLLVARRLSVPVFGVGLPQHFLLKYRSARGEIFLDAFGGGKLLTVQDCVRFLSQAHLPFLDDYLRAVSDAEMLTRMLGNLLRVYLDRKDQRRYDRIAVMLKLLS